uniref:Uncharacterized protein n=1 Tax=viral metagenome TaxID=1070528 RepID=A0A6C0KJJ9_9ZZZZ
MEELDVCVNLKVLEKVEVGQKLITKGQYLNVEYDSIVPVGIRRWLRQDNRNEMLKKIRTSIDAAIELIDKLEDDDETPSGQIVLGCEYNLNYREYLSKSIQGLKNLKETYKDCTQTCAQIDVLIDTINGID